MSSARIEKGWGQERGKRQEVREQIRTLLEDFEVISGETEEKPGAVVDFSPVTYSGGEDERFFWDLPAWEQEAIKREFFAAVGFREEEARVAGRYEFEVWGEGQGRVVVYETGRKDEGMYLHEVKFADGKDAYWIAGRDYRV